jgi:hypothetical protein
VKEKKEEEEKRKEKGKKVYEGSHFRGTHRVAEEEEEEEEKEDRLRRKRSRCLKVLFRHNLPGGTGDNHGNVQTNQVGSSRYSSDLYYGGIPVQSWPEFRVS